VTEAEWLTGTSYFTMFQFIRRGADRRKLRLFAVACCRRIPEMLVDERSRMAVSVSERYADGWATKEELSAAQFEAAKASSNAVELRRPIEAEALQGFKTLSHEEREAAWSRYYSSSKRTLAAKAAKSLARPTDRAAKMAEAMLLAAHWVFYAEIIGHTIPVIIHTRNNNSDLLRCVLGNPFRPPELAAERVTRDVLHLADAIYDERAYDRLPGLADALENAGCQSADVLAHCRAPGLHTRGCWVLDLIRLTR
jgi:hypothetical protein